MTEKIKNLFVKYRELIMYVIFGGLTTVVNWLVYYVIPHSEDSIAEFMILGKPITISEWLISQIIAWVAAVIFAFVVNKIFVFEDKNTESRALFRQIWQFVSVRIASFVLETLLMWILIDILSVNTDIAKIPVAVLTVVINYIASKLLVFRKK